MRGRDPWQVVGDLLYPLCVAGAWLAAFFRSKPVNSDSYYQPPELLYDREDILPCWGGCEEDTKHALYRWQDGPPTTECLVCGDVREVEE